MTSENGIATGSHVPIHLDSGAPRVHRSIIVQPLRSTVIASTSVQHGAIACNRRLTVNHNGRTGFTHLEVSFTFKSPTNLPLKRHSYREAKGLQQGLKEALKTRDPWDKEIEFQRKKYARCSRFFLHN